jgi:hypothetical protein
VFGVAHDDHDHHGHDHEHAHDHAHDHEHDEDDVDASAWFQSAKTLTCPACGAAGAVTLGGGVFCPSCGEVSKSPGFQPSE